MEKFCIDALVEGKTEERLLKILTRELKIPVLPIPIKKPGGKNRMPEKLKSFLLPSIGVEPRRVLILRDLDRGEIIVNIVRSFENIIKFLLPGKEVEMSKDEIFDNIFKFKAIVNSFPLYIVLHIAKAPHIKDIEWKDEKNITTDDYILALALDERVIQQFAKEAKIEPEKLRAKVQEEIPAVGVNNGIQFREAKDYLGIYMAMSLFYSIKRSEQDELFSGVVINRAFKYSRDYVNEIFKSLFEAINFLSEE